VVDTKMLGNLERLSGDLPHAAWECAEGVPIDTELVTLAGAVRLRGQYAQLLPLLVAVRPPLRAHAVRFADLIDRGVVARPRGEVEPVLV
jgi:hypothetical protein